MSHNADQAWLVRAQAYSIAAAESEKSRERPASGEPELKGNMENVSAYLEAARQSSVQPRADGGRGALDRLAQEARETLTEQSQVIAELAARVDDSFGRAVGLMYSTPGHVVITGMGKSGNIGRKIAATLASTGTPSFFLHPAEAFHGDLGMITERDTLLLISYSGETEEVVRLLPHLLRM